MGKEIAVFVIAVLVVFGAYAWVCVVGAGKQFEEFEKRVPRG